MWNQHYVCGNVISSVLRCSNVFECQLWTFSILVMMKQNCCDPVTCTCHFLDCLCSNTSHSCAGVLLRACQITDIRNLWYGSMLNWGGVTQHPREASGLRLALLNMERGHTAKAAGSFWLAPNVAIQAGIGWADAARHHVVGTKPFWTKAKQGGKDIQIHTRTPTRI